MQLPFSREKDYMVRELGEGEGSVEVGEGRECITKSRKRKRGEMGVSSEKGLEGTNAERQEIMASMHGDVRCMEVKVG